MWEYLDILADNKDVLGSLHHLVQPYDVRMHEQPQNFDFPPHCRPLRPLVAPATCEPGSHNDATALTARTLESFAHDLPFSSIS